LKARGDFVRAVHPHTVGRYPDGVVLSYEPGYPTGPAVSVRIGSGSTVYGPAAHWEPIASKPEWLVRLEAEAAAPPTEESS
jgi:hypothetical protein